MNRLIAFENGNNKVVRVSNFVETDLLLVQRLDTQRIEFCESVLPFEEMSLPYKILRQVRTDEWENAIPISYGLTARLVSREHLIDTDFSSFSIPIGGQQDSKSKYLPWILFVLFFIFIGTLPLFLSNTLQKEEVKEVAKEIELIPKRTVRIASRKSPTLKRSQNQRPSSKVSKKPVVRKSAVLGVLGSLKKSSQKGSLDLNAAKASDGIGLGGDQGSGGSQKSIYAKGMKNAALGDGTNVQGGGGYGTKGVGGGKAGYGKVSMVGATSGMDLTPLSHEATVSSGLDRDLIASVVRSHMGQIRYCYEQGLQQNGTLQGRVTAQWTVSSSGAVVAAKIKNSSLRSRLVEECIVRHIRSWKFPLPKGSASVPISYPFLLKRTGQG